MARPGRPPNMADFRSLQGPDFFQRADLFGDFLAARIESGTWAYTKKLLGPATPRATFTGADGKTIEGVNFCSQNYLSLAQREDIQDAADEANRKYGVHSAGSSALQGNSDVSQELEKKLADFTGYDHALLYPFGWGAGYGAIRGFVREHDHVVMDALSHSCLQEGARAATVKENIHSAKHLDNNDFEKKIKEIRENDPEAGIFVVAESLYSMDSDVPDLAGLQAICHRYNATLMVDAAHDLGALGPNGLGVMEDQNMAGKVDILMGSFSKTFASNGGFVACNSKNALDYLRFYSPTQTFSNALMPGQVAVITKSLEIIQSDEGKELREKLMNNAVRLRELLTDAGFIVMGQPSAIVPVFLGEEQQAQTLWKQLTDNGTGSNLVEFPGVAVRKSRLRLQLQADHEEAHLEEFTKALRKAADEVGFSYGRRDFRGPQPLRLAA